MRYMSGQLASSFINAWFNHPVTGTGKRACTTWPRCWNGAVVGSDMGQWQTILKDALPEDRLQRKQSSAAVEEKRWRAKVNRIHAGRKAGPRRRSLPKVSGPLGRLPSRDFVSSSPRTSTPLPSASYLSLTSRVLPSRLAVRRSRLCAAHPSSRPLAKDAGYAETLAALRGRIAVGLVPPEVARAFRLCEVAAFPKGHDCV